MTRSRTLCLFVLLVGCTRRLVLTDAPPDAGSGDASSEPEDAAPPLSADDAGVVLCGNHRCACANDEDDDGDGLTDGLDPECSAAFDDDELTFATGVRVNDNKKCSDCFFDGNAGQDDGCSVSASCRTGGAPSAGVCDTCDASDTCLTRCLPLVPNGCDCFGCCEVYRAEGALSVSLVAGCKLSLLGDSAVCPRCTLNPSCMNECGVCELCSGKTLADLPEECSESGPVCDEGQATCGPERPCPSGEYCAQGCCLPPLL